MMLQLNLLEQEGLKALHYSQVDFHANLIVLSESVKHLLMNVICGQSTGELLMKLDPNGFWVKMYEGYCQVKMDNSLETYSEILPTWGTMLDGAVMEQIGLEPYIKERGYLSLPTPTATDYKGCSSKRYKGSKYYRGTRTVEALRSGKEDPCYTNPNFVEVLMGFPEGWTDLSV